MQIPVISIGAVAAGFPSPAGDYLEERIDLNDVLIRHPQATFIVRTEGDSMLNAFIPPKALLVVDKSMIAQNGDIIVAVLNGEFTVKYLQRNDFKCKLIAANRKYPDIDVTPEMGMTVWGVVTHILINPKDVRHVCTR